VTVHELLAERAGQGDRPAFIEGATGRAFTWGDIEGRATALAADPRPPGTPLALRMPDPLDNVATFLAALATSVPVVPLDPMAPPHAVDPAPPGAAVVMASSGTTGRPKIIALTEAQLLHTARAVVAHHRLGPDDRGYCPLPLFHINALVVGVLSTLVAGSSLVIDRRFSRRTLWSTVATHDVTWVNAVPAIIALLAEAPAPDPAVARRVRFVRSASAPLAPAVRARFEAHCGIGVLETYGMTEAASQITANPIEAADRRPGSVGRPVDVELRVVRGDGTPLPPGQVGEVEIRGPAVASTPPGRWLATADLGRLDADGFLYLAGRADDVINRGGEKVYPGDVEAVLLADPRVAAAAVVGRAHPVFGDEPVAFVVPGAGRVDRPRLAAELALRCQSTLSRFKVPAQISVVDALPAGPTGKVRRRDVRRTLVQRSSS
jgi:acyl-CoA synthetase (AMP-forming)/AMP-acid ligase II